MNKEERDRLRLALSVMSGRVSPENAEYELFGGYYRRSNEDVMSECEDIVFRLIESSLSRQENDPYPD
jgi:hypothetical protein